MHGGWLQIIRQNRNCGTLYTTSGFWPRVRARALRAPVFLGPLVRQTGRCAPPPPPIAASLLPQKYRNKLFPETKCLPSGSNSGCLGHIFFHWAKLHHTELRCTLLSYTVHFGKINIIKRNSSFGNNPRKCSTNLLYCHI